MDSRQSNSYIPLSNATSSPAQHYRQASSQHASEEPHRRGEWTGYHSGYPHSTTEPSADFQTWQEQNAAFTNGPNYQAQGRWPEQQQQQPWGIFNPSYPPTATFPQANFQNSFLWQQQTWQQQYPQYGHVNPAFFPQQPVANTQYHANDTSGYRGSDTGYGAAYNARQQPEYGYNPDSQAYHIPVANSQTQAASNNRYGAHRYKNALSQTQRKTQPASNYTGNPTAARPATYPVEERYDNRFSQLECLMNPLYMRSPQLTPSGENSRQYLLPHPKPSSSYFEQAKLPPRRLSNPKKLLIVLDLNGTLLLRIGRGSNYTPRPHVDEFLAYCLENHALIIWSSAKSPNVTGMVAQLFTAEQHSKLVKIWSRDHLRLGVHFNAKVQVYKQLTWLWEDAEVQASFPAPESVPFKLEDGWKEAPPAKWDQSNTVLLDDSVDKAASEPHNLVQIDEFTKENKGDGQDVLGRVVAYIEDLKWEADVSAAMREKPFVNGQGEGWDWVKRERRPSA